jgi:ribosome recycling factor
MPKKPWKNSRRKDDLARGEKELEKVTSDHVGKIDEILKHKEAELLEV